MKAASSGLSTGLRARWPQIDGIGRNSAFCMRATSRRLSSTVKWRSVSHGITVASAVIAPNALSRSPPQSSLVHRIFSNLKVWALGVYHGLRRTHLQSYLDEFVFRFNRRRTRYTAFRSLLGIAAAHQPTPYKMLISPEAKT